MQGKSKYRVLVTQNLGGQDSTEAFLSGLYNIPMFPEILRSYTSYSVIIQY